jgi:hypothetical protein
VLEKAVLTWSENQYFDRTLADSTEEHQPEPPDELIMLWEVESFDALPWPGGLLNQPHILMQQLNLCRNTRDTVRQQADMARTAKEQEDRRLDNARSQITFSR